MPRLLITSLLMAVGGLASPLAVAEQQPESAPTAYEEFRALFTAGRYAEALPLAERAVAETDPGATGSRDLAAALIDLAATQSRLGNLGGAEASYLRAFTLLESSQGMSSLRFLAPLAGLAAVYAAQNRHELAIDFYRQALAVFRRSQGLFDPAQTSLVEALAASCEAIRDYPGAEAERRYLVQIAARNFESNDPRVVQALSQLALWYESMQNYATARQVHVQIYEIASKEGGKNNPALIDALLGIGRTHRLQFITDPDSVGKPFIAVEQISDLRLPGLIVPAQRDFNPKKMDSMGRRALLDALELLEGKTDPPADLLGRTLLELGDWYLSSSQPDTAMRYYSRAAPLFAASLKDGGTNPLLAPRLVAYRPPLAAIAEKWQPYKETIARHASFELTVTEKGGTEDIVVTSSDMTSMQAFQLRQALEHALFSPRFENGSPASTAGVKFNAEWYELIPPKTPDPEAVPAAGT
jgi:tetratricopeptide (TPR) repeat protein